MDSGWLLADGEAVSSMVRERTPWARHRVLTVVRRGEAGVELRAPTVLMGPLDLVRMRDGAADRVRHARRRPVCLLLPRTIIVLGPGDAARFGVRAGSTLEVRWAE